jgi:methionine-rich copper-binding protein CopC
MRFSSDNLAFSSPENYNSAKEWRLTDSDGTKTVYVRFRDAAGNWSTASISDSIIMDTTSPKVVSTSPEPGARNVAINSSIMVDFSEEVDENSLSITVTGAVGGDLSGKASHSVNRQTGRSTLTFLPDGNFNDEDNVTVEVTARDPAANSVAYSMEFSTGISVWPGDTNGDGTVDILDVLPIGRYWQEEGDTRNPASTSWEAQPAVPWEKEASTHADTDGNGIVNEEDVIAVDRNWGQFRNGANPEGRDAGEPDLWLPSPGVGQLKAYLSMLIASAEAERVPAYSLLGQNYPNPFNPETWIPYQLSEGSAVRIEIFNASGQIVRTLRLGYRDAGIYVTKQKAVHWDGRNDLGEPVSSGVYFYSIKAGNFTSMRKLIVCE